MSKFVLFPEIMGSDQLLPVDGRFGLERIKMEAADHVHRLRNIHLTITRAQLCAGRVSDPSILHSWNI